MAYPSAEADGNYIVLSYLNFMDDNEHCGLFSE